MNKKKENKKGLTMIILLFVFCFFPFVAFGSFLESGQTALPAEIPLDVESEPETPIEPVEPETPIEPVEPETPIEQVMDLIKIVPDDEKWLNVEYSTSVKKIKKDLIIDVKTINNDDVLVSYKGDIAPIEKNEIIELRKSNSQVFNKNGKKIARIYTVEKFYKNGNDWNLIDYATTTQDVIVGYNKKPVFKIFETAHADDLSSLFGYTITSVSNTDLWETLRLATTTANHTLASIVSGPKHLAGTDKQNNRAFFGVVNEYLSDYIATSAKFCLVPSTIGNAQSLSHGLYLHNRPNFFEPFGGYPLNIYGDLISATSSKSNLVLNNEFCFIINDVGIDYFNNHTTIPFGILTSWDVSGLPALPSGTDNRVIYISNPIVGTIPYFEVNLTERTSGGSETGTSTVGEYYGANQFLFFYFILAELGILTFLCLFLAYNLARCFA